MQNLDSEPGNQDLFYESFYSKTIGENASGFRSLLWKYPHRIFERNFKTNSNQVILEVGAGNGEHIPFVVPDYLSYTALDLRLSSKLRSHESKRITCLEGDVVSLKEHSDSHYDRVIATCLLAHLSDPERALREMRRVVKSHGFIQIYLPCEPGILLSIFRKVVTAPAVKKMGFNGFDLFIAREHRNSLPNMLTLINYAFAGDDVRVLRRPFPAMLWFLNLFFLVEIRVKK